MLRKRSQKYKIEYSFIVSVQNKNRMKQITNKVKRLWYFYGLMHQMSVIILYVAKTHKIINVFVNFIVFGL